MPTKRPLCTFLTTTYGRVAREPHLLEECVYWFLQQTIHPKCELLIFNDSPGQTIVCDAPGVRVVNCPERYATWGAKLNAALEEARGSIVLPQDDDDVSLPWRAEQAVLAMDDSDYFVPDVRFFSDGSAPPRLTTHGCGWHASAYRRASMLGHYNPLAYAEADQDAFQYAQTNLVRSPHRLDAATASYCYIWGRSCQHMSGDTNLARAYGNMVCGPPGTYALVPRKRRDWLAETAAYRTAIPMGCDLLPTL